MTYLIDKLIKKNIIPDFLLRNGIRVLLKQRLVEEENSYLLSSGKNKNSFIESMKTSPIALKSPEANDQHYEVPTSFFEKVLGKHLKYSSGYWTENTKTLDDAEQTMLALTCERAGLNDGANILELGCGWGSLTLYMAEQYPNATITAASNSNTQKAFIDKKAKERQLSNITVITCDINDLNLTETYDHIVSIEMFEHMRNYEALLKKVSSYLKSDGSAFIHIFGHRDYLYPFLEDNSSNWMGRHFFSGGIMPSFDIFSHFSSDMKVVNSWKVNGQHYQKTCEAWLSKTTVEKDNLIHLFRKAYPGATGLDHWCNWRVFFMACAELFGYNNGDDWQVYHYVLKKV